MPAVSPASPLKLQITKAAPVTPLTLDPSTREIVVEPGAEAVLQEPTTSGELKITLGEGARLTHYRLFLQPVRETVDARVSVTLAPASTYVSHVFELGAADVTHRMHVRMNGEGAECILNGLYLATGSQRIENHTLIEHLRPQGTSRELYKGILDDQAQAVFDGLVIVQPEAQKTDSSQTNKNLLLSAAARANSTPELKILANDVKCKHGATIGQLDPAQLFYLRSRGLPEAEARQLLIQAFANEMIELVPLAPLRERLQQLFLGRFSR